MKEKPSELRTPERKMPKGRLFQKGQSGNPGGVSKEKRSFLERLTTDDADEVYTAMMDLVRERNPPAVIRAWEYVVGKPKERHEHTGKDGGAINVKAETSEPLNTFELRDLAASYLTATAGVAAGTENQPLDEAEADDKTGGIPPASTP